MEVTPDWVERVAVTGIDAARGVTATIDAATNTLHITVDTGADAGGPDGSNCAPHAIHVTTPEMFEVAVELLRGDIHVTGTKLEGDLSLFTAEVRNARRIQTLHMAHGTLAHTNMTHDT